MGLIECKYLEFTVPCTGTVTYFDCDEIEVTINVVSGETYQVCSSSTELQSTCLGTIKVVEIGTCNYTTTTTTINPTPLTPIQPINECDVLTIFPMGVSCESTDPTYTNTYDGSATLIITGGTPPYQILWENGSVGPTISNLGVGEYKATIKDYYGDFTIMSTCILTAETPTTTTTTTTTPVPEYSDLCVVISEKKGRFETPVQTEFTYNGIVNDKPSWLSSGGTELIYWNTGTTQEWLVSGITTYVVYNPNPATPPLTGWVVLGENITVTVAEGSCSSIPDLAISVTKNEPTCSDDGSIIIQVNGGTPPYEYSINAGITYQSSPIFTGLGAGGYIAKVKDSLNLQQSQFVTLTNTTTNTTYTLTLTTTNTTFNINVIPTLPIGTTINFDLKYESTFSVAPNPTSATYNGGLNVLLDGSPILPGSPIVTNTTTYNSCNGGSNYITTNKLIWSNITMSPTTTLSGGINNTITPVLPSPPCYSATKNYTITLDNVSINGCQCCSVVTQQVAQTGGSTGQLS